MYFKFIALLLFLLSSVSASASWTAKRIKDPMGGPSSTDLCSISKNSVVQSFPYNRGKTSMRLCVSKTGDSYETYITVNENYTNFCDCTKFYETSTLRRFCNPVNIAFQQQQREKAKPMRIGDPAIFFKM